MAAEVKILGFEWLLNGGRITKSDFCGYLEGISGKEFDKKNIGNNQTKRPLYWGCNENH